MKKVQNQPEKIESLISMHITEALEVVAKVRDNIIM